MIELTEQQQHELDAAPSDPPRVMDPRTQTTYVLLPVSEYERLKDDDYEYDDSPWTREEREALAWEMIKDREDEWPEYNEEGEKP